MSGLSQDMRELEASPIARPRATRLTISSPASATNFASIAASVNGAEAVVFTAGIGEHSWKVREAALKNMEWMGIHLDADANGANAYEIISAKYSPTTVFVIPTNEELMIAQDTRRASLSTN